MRSADAMPIQARAVAVLIDREVERFAIRGQRIVRAAELQQQLAEQQLLLCSKIGSRASALALLTSAERSLEAQRRLLGDRCFEIRRGRTLVLGGSEVIGMQRLIAAARYHSAAVRCSSRRCDFNVDS